MLPDTFDDSSAGCDEKKKIKAIRAMLIMHEMTLILFIFTLFLSYANHSITNSYDGLAVCIGAGVM